MFPTSVNSCVRDPVVEFTVEKDLICGHSKIFKATFGGSFDESASKELTLEGVSPLTFRSFKYWLHYDKVRSNNGEIQEQPLERNETNP